jgi:hypothetical protein
MYSTIGRAKSEDFTGCKEYQPKYHGLLCMFVVNSCYFKLKSNL